MKKNTNTVLVISCIIIIFIILAFSIIKINNNLKESPKGEENTKTDQKTVDNYDCSFTKTYHIVNMLDNYIAEVPELSYIVIDMFQEHNAITHVIPTRLKDNLEKDKYYEFTYTIKGKGNIQNMSDIYQAISSTELYNNATEEEKQEIYKDKSLFVNLTIKETSRQGLDQIQEDICQNNS